MQIRVESKIFLYVLVVIIIGLALFFSYLLIDSQYGKFASNTDSTENNLNKVRNSFETNYEYLSDSVTPNTTYKFAFIDVYIDGLNIDKSSDRHISISGKLYLNDVSANVTVHMILNNKRLAVFEQIPFDGRVVYVGVDELSKYISKDGYIRISYLTDILKSDNFASLSIDKMNKCDVRDSICLLLSQNEYRISKAKRFGFENGENILLISKSVVLND